MIVYLYRRYDTTGEKLIVSVLAGTRNTRDPQRHDEEVFASQTHPLQPTFKLSMPPMLVQARIAAKRCCPVL